MKSQTRRIMTHVKSQHDFMWGYLKDLLEALFRPSMAFLILFGMTMTLCFALAFYAIEGHGVNPNVHNLFDAIYFSASTMTTVGFGDIAPVTPWGRGLAILMMFLGTGLFVSYTAVIATVIMSIEQAKVSGRNSLPTDPSSTQLSRQSKQ